MLIPHLSDNDGLDHGFDQNNLDAARDTSYSLDNVTNNAEIQGVVGAHVAPSTACAALHARFQPMSDIELQSLYTQLNSMKVDRGRGPSDL